MFTIFDKYTTNLYSVYNITVLVLCGIFKFKLQFYILTPFYLSFLVLVYCKNSLSRKETFADLAGCLMKDDIPLTQKRVSVYLLSVLVANNSKKKTFVLKFQDLLSHLCVTFL